MWFRFLLITLLTLQLGVQAAKTVYFNVQSHIYHNATCRYVVLCTKNCIWKNLDEAIRLGRPCKICGG